MELTRQERGWAGHFICANRCRFRRNTLLTCGTTRIVVSTVGLMETPWEKDSQFYDGPFDKIGYNRYYETMAFHSDHNDIRYHDADVSRPVEFDSPWTITELDADNQANDMHERVVAEISGKMVNGQL